MELSHYKAEFISEAEDHLDSLNSGLLDLEKDPHNKETVNRIFRAFHTLKGNSALMGLAKIAEVAHALEDVLAKVRDGKLEADRRIMDLLLSGVDALEQAIGHLRGSDEERIDTDVVQELQQVLGEKEARSGVSIPARAELDDAEHHAADLAVLDGQMVLRVIIIMDPQSPLRGAKARIIAKRLGELGTVIKTTPSAREMEQGKLDAEAEIILATGEPRERITQVANSVSDVKHTVILKLTEEYTRPPQAVQGAAEAKERQKADIMHQAASHDTKQVQSVKVEMARLDALVNLMGELLISNIRLQDMTKRQDYQGMGTLATGIDRLILDLQDQVRDIRMVPIANITARYPRMVRDLAEHEEKMVDLVMDGTHVEFDRTVLDQIGEPLVHMLRNAVDHGIEAPQERLAAGKPETGTIKLLIRREKNHAIVEVADDGRGIDPELVKRTCLRKGLATESEMARMSDQELQMLIFRAGASTNDVVTEVSGRGVGMDVVMSKTRELGGAVIMESTVGKGTSIKLKLPLSVAIITAMLVRVNRETYAIPMTSVDQIVDIEDRQVTTIQGHKVFVHRGITTPLVWLHHALGKQADMGGLLKVVLASKGESPVGLVVDEVIGQQPVLIKGLQDLVKGTRGCSGATILGDGSIALILDIDTLL